MDPYAQPQFMPGMQMPMQMPQYMPVPLPPPKPRSKAVLISVMVIVLLCLGGVGVYMLSNKRKLTPAACEHGVMLYSGSNFNGSSYCAKAGAVTADLPFVPQSMKAPAGLQYSMEAQTTAAGTFKSSGLGVGASSFANLPVTLKAVTSFSVLNIQV